MSNYSIRYIVASSNSCMYSSMCVGLQNVILLSFWCSQVVLCRGSFRHWEAGEVAGWQYVPRYVHTQYTANSPIISCRRATSAAIFGSNLIELQTGFSANIQVSTACSCPFLRVVVNIAGLELFPPKHPKSPPKKQADVIRRAVWIHWDPFTPLKQHFSSKQRSSVSRT